MKRKSPTEQLDEEYYDFIKVLNEESEERGSDSANERYKKVMAFGVTLIAFYLRCIFFLLACGVGILAAHIVTGG